MSRNKRSNRCTTWSVLEIAGCITIVEHTWVAMCTTDYVVYSVYCRDLVVGRDYIYRAVPAVSCCWGQSYSQPALTSRRLWFLFWWMSSTGWCDSWRALFTERGLSRCFWLWLTIYKLSTYVCYCTCSTFNCIPSLQNQTKVELFKCVPWTKIFVSIFFYNLQFQRLDTSEKSGQIWNTIKTTSID